MSPLTKTGKTILSALQARHGTQKGKSVFYAMRNAKKLKDVERRRPARGFARMEHHS